MPLPTRYRNYEKPTWPQLPPNPSTRHPEIRVFCGPKDLCTQPAGQQTPASAQILRAAKGADLRMTKLSRIAANSHRSLDNGKAARKGRLVLLRHPPQNIRAGS